METSVPPPSRRMGVRPEVETAQGRVAGSEVRGIRVFRGIPFASPPLGVRRFHGPDSPEPWTGILEATKPGAVVARLPWKLTTPSRSIPTRAMCRMTPPPRQ